MNINKLIAIVATLFFTACAEGTAPRFGSDLPSRAIDDRFVRDALVWDDSLEIPIFISLFESDGFIAACLAAYRVRGIRDRQALDALFITADGLSLFRGLGWANSYPTPEPLDGHVANCRQSAVPATENPEFEFGLIRTRF